MHNTPPPLHRPAHPLSRGELKKKKKPRPCAIPLLRGVEGCVTRQERRCALTRTAAKHTPATPQAGAPPLKRGVEEKRQAGAPPLKRGVEEKKGRPLRVPY